MPRCALFPAPMPVADFQEFPANRCATGLSLLPEGYRASLRRSPAPIERAYDHPQ